MKARWESLSPCARRYVTVVTLVDVVLRTAALTDLLRRPHAEVSGRKAWWGGALAVVASAGVLPAAYFIWGVRRNVDRANESTAASAVTSTR